MNLNAFDRKLNTIFSHFPIDEYEYRERVRPIKVMMTMYRMRLHEQIDLVKAEELFELWQPD